MFRMLIYWECLLLWCKCICIVKLCLCRQRNSFYSLVPTENVFWCNLSAFTFSASLPLNECLWDYILNFSISVSQQVHAHILVSGVPACLGKKKKKNFPKTRVPLGKTERAIYLKQSLPARPGGEKNSQWNSSFRNSSSTCVNIQKT